MNNIKLFDTNTFLERHLGPNIAETQEMLQALGLNSVGELMYEVLPDKIRNAKELPIDEAVDEQTFLKQLQQIAAKNKVWKSYIGMGYYGTVTPTVIQRNIFENPGWYTQYTPYQAEIAQGRLEALLNFQTAVADLTGLPVANASLLDEGTAAAEAMLMLYRIKNKRSKKEPAKILLVADSCLPTTIDVVATRAEPLGIEVKVMPAANFVINEQVFAALVQYPSHTGSVEDYSELVQELTANNAYLIVAADILSLSLLKPPGEWGADVVVGSTQRLGVPMGYGGPHAAYFATKEDFLRQIPGRIIGVSMDVKGNNAYRMALQTREQHIKRDKATSNICTAQALLAIMAGMYAVYHGSDGLTTIAKKIHLLTVLLNKGLKKLGYTQVNQYFFDTLLVDLKQHTATSGLRVRRTAELEEVNFRYFNEDTDLIGISLDETCTIADVQQILNIFAAANNETAEAYELEVVNELSLQISDNLTRTSEFLSHPVFKKYRSETAMLRYMRSLERKDLSLTHAMIPLGSCTMKLNATTQLMPVSWPAFAHLHPFVPIEQAAGYQQIFEELERDLSIITGFEACSLQPNSGAQGEYTGLMTIRAYHLHNNNAHRNIALVPSSAHGTNPASAVMAGMKVVIVKCDERGNIDVADLTTKAEQYSDNLAALMVTYPSTHGVFEVEIQQICAVIHQHGGLVYMDGANMNAQVGYTSPAMIGADVCHLNLHKTFSIPHGGGGPGMGPICVNDKLAPFLPGHRFKQQTGDKNITAIASAPWGSASILLISYAYIKLLGAKGVTQSTAIAILNANYIKQRLQEHYNVLYVGDRGMVAHELILDLRPFKRSIGLEVDDLAKRLMDYSFHAPTVSFPVAGTIMIEPTESESKAEIDRFCEAMISIRQEIREIELGIVDKNDNVLKNAPHCLAEITADNWQYGYTRQKAAFPLPYLYDAKFWVGVSRINNTYGDRNVICSCPPIADYVE